MALAQQIQLQGSDAGARERARRIAGSPALIVVGRRLLSAIVVVWGVTFMTFVVLSALPNDTAQVLLGLHATPADVARLNHALGLDEPFPVRYWHWLVSVLHGNLGTDLEGASVNSQLAQHLPVTMELLAYALVGSVVLALIVAVLAARKPGGIADRVSTAISLLG
ncbi:MAG TPA: ABC transporter permease, partial [Trebonia sp.]|nr:ABC transporter permease [Trebonia sp.]